MRRLNIQLVGWGDLMFVNNKTGQKSDRLRIPTGTAPETAKRAFELAGWEFPPNAEVSEDGAFFIYSVSSDKKKVTEEPDGGADE